MYHLWNYQTPRLLSSGFRYKWILQSAMGCAAVAVVIVYAFASTFTTFGDFDDDGYFLQACRDFLSGRTPYDQVFSIYGPFTFYSGAFIAGFKADNVTHDGFRWALLPAWIAIALLMAGIIWRWTGRFSPAVIAFLLIGFRLVDLAGSVGHPQVWVILAVAVLLWLGVEWTYLPTQQWRAFCTGFLIGSVFLFKINIGIYIAVAIALAGSLLLTGRLRTLTSGVLSAAAIGLGLMLLVSTSTASERYFALVYVLSLAGTVAIAIYRAGEQRPSLRNLVWVMAGFAICLFVGIGVILFYGTTTTALFRSLILYPALLISSYHMPFVGATKKVSIIISIAGLGAAVAAFYGRYLGRRVPAWLDLLKVAAGAGLLCASIRWPGQELTGSLLFLWLLVDNPKLSQHQYANRLLLVVLCLLFSLQLYPIAGAQLVWAELLPIVAAALLLADGANCVEHNLSGGKLVRLACATAVWTGPVLAILLFLPFGKAALSRYLQWHDAQSLGLPGAYWLRLTPQQTARLTVPVNKIKQYCEVVLTTPGMYSYSIWSGVPPAEEKRINAWPFLWPEEILRKDLPKLREHDGGCVLVNEAEYRFFKHIAVSTGNDELLPEIQRTMTPIFTFQDITLYKAVGAPETIPHSDADTHAQRATH